MFRCTGNCGSCGRCKGTSDGNSSAKRKSDILNDKMSLQTDGREGIGATFDIGTTTIAGMLWNMQSGKCIAKGGMANPQRPFGGDVISRISFCMEKPENLQSLRSLLTAGLNEMIDELCRQAGIKTQDVQEAVFCGNTAMSHILTGHSVSSLAHAPFKSDYEGSIRMYGIEAGLNMYPEGDVLILPCIGGHIGGDITAGIAAVGLDKSQGLNLLIDIGTNGELVLADEGRLYACSAAAGPAFEGASIKWGMRAEKGAIEKIEIVNGEAMFSTIGGKPAKGICGSGLIDAIAEMLSAGIIDKSGRMSPSYDSEFIVLARERDEDIVITQKDIREFQYAKGAIKAAWKLLLKNAGKRESDIDRVYVAGAFGNYIDVQNAVKAGILPALPVEKIISVGNTASAGAAMALISKEEKLRMNKIAAETEHIESAEDPEFQRLYINCLGF